MLMEGKAWSTTTKQCYRTYKVVLPSLWWSRLVSYQREVDTWKCKLTAAVSFKKLTFRAWALRQSKYDEVTSATACASAVHVCLKNNFMGIYKLGGWLLPCTVLIHCFLQVLYICTYAYSPGLSRSLRDTEPISRSLMQFTKSPW